VVELDTVSGRIAKALYPQHDIRLEDFEDTRLPANSVDVVIGNVPFADLKKSYWGAPLLHEFCIAKSLDVLKPGGIMALVVTHDLLDRTQPDFRLLLDAHAELLWCHPAAR
jgi:hypothetical protein